GQEDQREEPVEPALPGVEIVGEAGILVDPVGEEQRAGEEEERGIADDEEIELEAPGPDPAEPELEPPEVQHGEQEEQHPAEMHRIEPRPRRMLHEPCEPGQEPGDAETGHEADDDADMEE